MTMLPPSQGVPTRTLRRVLDGERGIRSRIERRFAGRGARRALVTAWAAVTIALAVLPLVVRLQDVLGPAMLLGVSGSWLISDPLPLLALSGVLGLIVRTAVRAVADLPDERIDERQVALRDRSHLVAYRIATTTVALILLGSYVITDATATQALAGPVRDWLGSDLFVAFVALAAFLPSAVVAWYAPDETAEDTGDDEPVRSST